MILEMLRWWYSTGWLQAMHRISSWPQGIERSFSILLLLKTLFSPWKRIVTAGGRSLDEKVKASLDNLVSRCIGFAIRSGVLIAAGIAAFSSFFGAIIIVLVWPLMPLAIIYFVVRSITG
jgi:hypothetical protein